MLLTQAFSRHIIGVAPEQLYCTEAKNKNHSKNSTIKTTVPRRRLFFIGFKFAQQIKNSHSGCLSMVELAGTAPASKR